LTLTEARNPPFHIQPVFVPVKLTPAEVGKKIGTFPIVNSFWATPTPMFVVTVKGFTEAGRASTTVKAYVPESFRLWAYSAVPAIRGEAVPLKDSPPA
jgi:hypothetical protein